MNRRSSTASYGSLRHIIDESVVSLTHRSASLSLEPEPRRCVWTCWTASDIVVPLKLAKTRQWLTELYITLVQYEPYCARHTSGCVCPINLFGTDSQDLFVGNTAVIRT